MNKKIKTITVIIAGAVLMFGIGRLSTPSVQKSSDHEHDPVASGQNETTWTCSMHPQIQQSEPGKCPICGMDLIPQEEDSTNEIGPRALMLSETAKALAGIQTSLVERRFPEAEIRMVGKVDYDETRLQSLSARFPARIDRLYVNYTGVPVNRGDHLAEIYSPQLLIAQKELIIATKYDPEGVTAHAAREKLRLWGLSPAQIKAIEKSHKAEDSVEIESPISGVVVEKYIKEGDYLNTGQSLFKIADLSHLWVYLDAYESDLSWLRYGQTVEFKVKSYPDKVFEGRIIFINPVLDEKTRTVKVRVDVDNKAGMLKAGMFAQAVVYSKISSSGKVYTPEYAGKWISPMHPEVVRNEPGPCPVCGMALVPVEELGYVQDEEALPPLVVPDTAVLRTGKRAVVYVLKDSSDKSIYEGREVVLGARAGNHYIVAEGLAEGDRVVTNGAFKIDSALQIQAKPSMMNPLPPMPNHHHDSMEAKAMDVPHAFKRKVDVLLSHYFGVQQALAKDDLDRAKVAAEQFAEFSHELDISQLPSAVMAVYQDIHKQIHPHVEDIIDAESIEQARGKTFEAYTGGIKRLVMELGTSGRQAVYEMHCSMALESGADWLQDNDDLVNPYYGKVMPYCGEVKRIVVEKITESEEAKHYEHE